MLRTSPEVDVAVLGSPPKPPPLPPVLFRPPYILLPYCEWPPPVNLSAADGVLNKLASGVRAIFELKNVCYIDY